MTQAVQVVPAQIQLVEQQQDKIYISTQNNGKNVKLTQMPRISGWSKSNTDPLSELGGGTHHFNISLDHSKVINTLNSYLSYKIKFVLNIDEAGNGLGRYYVKNNMLYYIPLKKNTAATAYEYPAQLDYTKQKALCLFPMNSCCILDQTTVNMGGNTITDAYVNRTTSILQSKFPKDYQDMTNDTFFDGEVFSYDVWNVNAGAIPLLASASAYTKQEIPGLYKNSTTATKGYFVFYRTFTIPLALINSVFEMQQMPQFIAGPQEIQLMIKLQNWSVRKLFMTETILSADTGITELALQIYNKYSDAVQTQMAAQQFGVIIQKINYDSQPLNNKDQAQNLQINNPHYSTNLLMLCNELQDTAKDDSTYLKQRFTLVSAEKQLELVNGKLPQQETGWFLSDLQVLRGTESEAVYSSELKDIQQIKREIYRSLNVLQQFDRSASPNLLTYQKWMFCYSMFVCNLQAFSTDEITGINDVKYDGYNSNEQYLRVKFQIKEYNNGFITNATPSSSFGDPDLQMACIQAFDYQILFNPQQQILKTSEEPHVKM